MLTMQPRNIVEDSSDDGEEESAMEIQMRQASNDMLWNTSAQGSIIEKYTTQNKTIPFNEVEMPGGMTNVIPAKVKHKHHGQVDEDHLEF